MPYQVLLGILLVIPTYQVSGSAVPEVVRLHESSVNAINTIDATMTVRVFGASDGFRKPLQQRVMRWSKQGTRQRIRQKLDMEGGSGGTSYLGYMDVMIEDGSMKKLLGWNPDAPPDLSPVRNSDVKASIEPFSGELPPPLSPPLELLKMEFVMIGGDPPRSLGELVRDAGRDTQIEAASVNDNRVVRLIIPHTSAAGQRSESVYVIDLDPDHNYLSRRVETRAVNESVDGSPPVSFRNVTEVVDFKKISDDVYLPVRLENWVYEGGAEKPNMLVKVDVDVHAVNEPLPPAIFAFRFPEYSIVRTLPPVNGRVKAELWGADDRPIQEINSQADLIEIAKQRGFDVDNPYRGSRPPGIGWVILALIVGACMVVVVLLLRARRIPKAE